MGFCPISPIFRNFPSVVFFCSLLRDTLSPALPEAVKKGIFPQKAPPDAAGGRNRNDPEGRELRDNTASGIQKEERISSQIRVIRPRGSLCARPVPSGSGG